MSLKEYLLTLIVNKYVHVCCTCTCMLYIFCLVCNLLRVGVQAVFSPTDSVLATHINSICDALDIPNIGRSAHDFSINVYPSKEYVNQAFIDVIRYLNWTRFGILHEREYGKLCI